LLPVFGVPREIKLPTWCSFFAGKEVIDLVNMLAHDWGKKVRSEDVHADEEARFENFLLPDSILAVGFY
jgi:hypothetical protein